MPTNGCLIQDGRGRPPLAVESSDADTPRGLRLGELDPLAWRARRKELKAESDSLSLFFTQIPAFCDRTPSPGNQGAPEPPLQKPIVQGDGPFGSGLIRCTGD